ncbi:MAG: Mu transposase C-terminal domain-containing protein [Clostridia bacterium]|nr:Mu transposase C-terminal domain-containing protein [Clostridia bacterium]
MILTLLPRAKEKFTRRRLKLNGLRYYADGYKEQFLRGGDVIVSYDPENCNKVWLKKTVLSSNSL